MEIMGKRLRQLRVDAGLSQLKIAEMLSVKQSSVNRYEQNISTPTTENLIIYADYFDVSLDYIFGRCESPQGKLYEYQSEVFREKLKNNDELKNFVEMCFDPNSSMNSKFKETLVKMITEGGNK
jgi:Predicted transcriptional regulators